LTGLLREESWEDCGGGPGKKVEPYESGRKAYQVMVKIVCPNCDFSKEIPEERISPSAQWATCPQCKNRFQFRNAVPLPVVDPGPAETGDRTEQDRTLSPWEMRSDIGLSAGISQTLKAVLFSPTDFFKHAAVEGGIREPLAFGLLTGSLGMMFEVFWQVLFTGESLAAFGETLLGPYAMMGAFLGAMALCPVFTFFAILMTSLIAHVLLIPVRGGRNGFEATFRVTSFCQAAQVWGVVPVVGGLIGALWFFAAQLIGLKEIHETSYLRVGMALTIPLVFILVLLVIIVVQGWI
jgi:hypothetical protein